MGFELVSPKQNTGMVWSLDPIFAVTFSELTNPAKKRLRYFKRQIIKTLVGRSGGPTALGAANHGSIPRIEIVFPLKI